MGTKPNLPHNKRFFCNTCRTLTNHRLLSSHARNLDYDDRTAWFEDEVFLFWICSGCDTATLEKVYTNVGLYDEESRQIYEPIDFYPKRSEKSVDSKHFKQLPDKLDRIYRETLKAFNDDSDILCAAGLRALIEGICADKKIKGSDLRRQIDNLAGFLPKNIVTGLHGFRFIGNTALHRLNPPKKDDLRLAIEVSEDILNFLYELDYKASRLRKAGERKSHHRVEPAKQ